MHRLPIPPERIATNLPLTTEERHYLLDVLRLSSGDEIEVFDGIGGHFLAKIDLNGGDGSNGVASLCLGERLPDEDFGVQIEIAPALIKNDRLDWVMEKATELGCERIFPWEGQNSVVHLTAQKGVERQNRWQKIAQSAARQCGRSVIPTVDAPRNIQQVVEDAVRRNVLVVVLYERENVQNTLTKIALREAKNRPILIVTGPEGGFREEEVEGCRSVGALTASLGRRIVRAETAPIVAMAALRAVFGEM